MIGCQTFSFWSVILVFGFHFFPSFSLKFVPFNFLLQSSLNGSTSNLQDSNGRSFATSFSAQSGAASPVFHHSGQWIFLEFYLLFYTKLD